MTDEAPETPAKYTEEELIETLQALESDVVTTASSPVDEAIDFLETAAKTLDAVYADGVFGPNDFDALKPLWEQSWKLADIADELEKDVKGMGLLRKVTTAVKTIKAMVKLFKAMKRAKAARQAILK